MSEPTLDYNVLMNVSFRGDPFTPVTLKDEYVADEAVLSVMYHVHNEAGTCSRNVFGDTCLAV